MSIMTHTLLLYCLIKNHNKIVSKPFPTTLRPCRCCRPYYDRQPSILTHPLEPSWRGRHRRRVVLHDGPLLGAARVPPECEAEARPLLDGLAVFPLPRKRVRTRLDSELAVHPDRYRGVLHQPQLGQPGEVILVGQNVAFCTMDRRRRSVIGGVSIGRGAGGRNL